MKIAQINPGHMTIPPNSWGAVEKIIWYYKVESEKKGHEVHIKYINEIQHGEFDIVHTHMWNHALEMYEKGIPYIYTFHDHHAFIYGKESDVYSNNILAMKHSKISIVPAKYLVEYFENIPIYLRHGINPEEFYPSSTNDSPKLLIVGNNGLAGDVTFDRKGFRYAIEAAEKLNMPITVVGPTNSNKQFFESNKDLIKPNVEIKYDLTDKELQDVYRSHDILIHASSVEAGHPPLTLLEASACGLPIITTDCAGELFTTLTSRDSDDVAMNVSKVLKLYALNKSKTIKSVEPFYWENVVNDLLKIYDGILEKNMRKSVIGIYDKLIGNNKPKIQVIHLLTNTSHEREKKSISFISKLKDYGFDYKQQINKIYDEIPPKEFCSRPDHIGETPGYIGNGYGFLTGRHYGCYLAHTNAIESIDENYDYTIIFEADANIETSYEEFVNGIFKCCDKSIIDDFYSVSLSNNYGPDIQIIDENFASGKIQNLAHAYMIPNRHKSWFVERIKDTPWDVFDIWMNDVFLKTDKKRYLTRKNYSSQIEGMSLLDGNTKWTKKLKHYDYIEIGTSEFDTLVEKLPESYVGISIEPIQEYLEKLPNIKNNTKLNLAISNQDKISKIYYVDPSDIQKYNLPDWIRGCNSINEKHPSVMDYLKKNELEFLCSSKDIKTISFNTFIDEYNIDSVDFLKIDTEGHDFVIIRDMLNSKIRPKKISFEANSLYSEDDILSIINLLEINGYHLTHRTLNDITMSLIEKNLYEINKKPILIISAGRRLDYLTKTIRSLFDKNPNFNEQVSNVWVLDDRSNHQDRFHMDKLLSSYFGDNYNTIQFNKNEPYYFVNKFNHIKKIVEKDDIVFLIEDDWECHDNLRLGFHVNNLINSDWTQIAFADPLEIQDNELIKNYMINFDYWKNPFPEIFKHPHEWNGDVCFWNTVRMNNWTNNPSIIKGEVFYRRDFFVGPNFEGIFADTINANQVFTNECLFRHFGKDSLIGKL